jgi:hypothetical protein
MSSLPSIALPKVFRQVDDVGAFHIRHIEGFAEHREQRRDLPAQLGNLDGVIPAPFIAQLVDQVRPCTSLDEHG